LSKPALYFHTIRHLRPVQIAARAWRQVHRPGPDLRAAPPLRVPTGVYVPPRAPPQTLIAPDTFRFLSVERRCAAAADWRATDAARLWRYHLHYFADLNAQGAEARGLWHRALLERWVHENPVGLAEGWEPYPLSLRLVNWIKWSLRGNSLPPACRSSMAVQTRWLAGRLEYHLLGNHLLANAKALVHAGLYFDGSEAEGWYRRGLDILEAQLPEQVLADGGHCELSTMYHALVLEDLLDLINVMHAFGREPPAHWREAVAAMRRWLLAMSHPDGDVAFFNDAAFDGAASPAQLEAYAFRLGLPAVAPPDEPLTVLAASGYVRATAGAACLICDCAAVGADYLPAHGHADTLSFELSLGRQRLLVNSGVSEYVNGRERLRQRGTTAHNTVTVNGEDSSEVWGSFRVARRARARLRAATADAAVIIEGCHDGYERLAGCNRHKRRWVLDARSLRIEDYISGSFGHAEARLHLHPDIDARANAAGEVTLRRGEEPLAVVSFERAASVEVLRGTWHPRFGAAVANSCISASLAGASLTSWVRWR
jgi:uncharacterized heparinase superfamily protein